MFPNVPRKKYYSYWLDSTISLETSCSIEKRKLPNIWTEFQIFETLMNWDRWSSEVDSSEYSQIIDDLEEILKILDKETAIKLLKTLRMLKTKQKIFDMINYIKNTYIKE